MLRWHMCERENEKKIKIWNPLCQNENVIKINEMFRCYDGSGVKEKIQQKSRYVTIYA